MIYFNAWKYADDSFRRQFLLELCENESDRKTTSEKLKKDTEKIMNIKEWFKLPIKINPQMLIFTIISLVLSIILFIIYYWLKVPFVFILPIITSILTLFLSQHISNGIEIIMPLENQIIYPEDFEEEFKRKLKSYKKYDKIIIIIDDIDRCPKDMIYDVLDSLKNFLAPPDPKSDIYNNCYFITAMDNQAVIKSLSKNRSFEYKKEDVLKFFDVTLRLPKLHHDDIYEFMSNLLSSYNKSLTNKEEEIPITIIQNAYLSGYETPRKIKHFMNEFIVVKEIVDERIERGLIPKSISRNTLYEVASGILIIKMNCLVEYNDIVDNYNGSIERYYKKVKEETKASISERPIMQLINRLNLHKKDNISQYIIYSKLPNYAANINGYLTIQKVIIDDPSNSTKEERDILFGNNKEDIEKLIRSNLIQQEGDFFQYLLVWVFILLDEMKINSYALNKVILLKIENANEIKFLEYKDFSKHMKMMYKEVDVGDILNKFTNSINNKEYCLPQSIASIIEDIYTYWGILTFGKKLVEQVNSILIKQLQNENKDEIMLMLANIDINNYYRVQLPSYDVVVNIVYYINSVNIDKNNLIIKLCKNYWTEKLYEPITNKYIEILQSFNDNEIQQWDSFPEIIEWIFSNIIEINKMMPSENAATIFDIISKRYNKQNVIGKITLFEVIIMTKLSVQDENKKQVIQRDLNNISVLFNANELEKIKIYIDDKEEYFPDIMDIWNSIVNALVDLIFVRMNSYSEKNRDIGLFMLKTHSKLINNQNTNKFMHNLIIQNNSTEINIWSIFIIELFNHDDKLDLWKNIIRYIQNRIINSNQDSILIKTLFELLAQIYKKLQSRDASGLDLNEISREKIISWLIGGFTNTEIQHAIQNNYDDLINTILNIDKNLIERIIDETIRLMINDVNYPLLLKLIPSVCRVINKRYKRFIVEYILFNMSLLKTNDMNKIKQSYNFLNEFDFDYSIKNKGLLNDLRDTMVEIDKRNQPNMNWKNMINKINKRIKNI